MLLYGVLLLDNPEERSYEQIIFKQHDGKTDFYFPDRFPLFNEINIIFLPNKFIIIAFITKFYVHSDILYHLYFTYLSHHPFVS